MDSLYDAGQKTRLYVSNKGSVSLYTSTADNESSWVKKGDVVLNSDLANRLVMNTGSTGIQSPFSGSTSHRLQIGMDGGVAVWKTTDGGTTWNIVKNL